MIFIVPNIWVNHVTILNIEPVRKFPLWFLNILEWFGDFFFIFYFFFADGDIFLLSRGSWSPPYGALHVTRYQSHFKRSSTSLSLFLHRPGVSFR